LLDDCLFILDNACVCLDRSLAAPQRRAPIMKRIGEWAADARKKPSICWSWRRLRGAAAPVAAGVQDLHRDEPGAVVAPAPLERRTARVVEQPTTVAEVAMNWSFWHLGRFSSSYRALFKELPSETQALRCLRARLQ
jgi:AraC family ethanolamine operon transcriptional activator